LDRLGEPRRFHHQEIAASLTPVPSSPFSDFLLAVRGGDNRIYSMVLFNDLTSTVWAPIGNQTITGNIAIVKDAAPNPPTMYQFDAVPVRMGCGGL
jgi:hypothetical protein